MTPISSPDQNARSLSERVPDALRYDGHSDDPWEVAGIMRAAMPGNARVLDVGCGTGSLTLIVNHEKGNRVLALEPDADRAEEARRRGIDIHCRELDAAFLREHGPFDAMIFADVLEHLPSPGGVLELAASGLAPDGLIFISVPNVAHWSVRGNLLLGRFEYEPVGIMDATHLRWFTEKSLRRFIKRAGLDIVSVKAAAGVNLPVYNRFILRRVPYRLRKPVVRLATRLMPRLFGSQFVVVARKLT